LDAILKIQQKLHEEYPNVLIEQHDPMTGPGMPRYTPTYFMHAKPGAFDELWGFEYMVVSLQDVLTRRACSLYYLNLAYGLPVYLHVDLRTDNANALMLWWYASTCRHLGFGGKPADLAVWDAQKKAMQTYNKLKRFFAQGVFYGLEETVHVHTLADVKQSVVNVFNLEEKPAKREIRFRLTEIGLPVAPVEIEGANFEQKGDEIALTLEVPARAHSLVKIDVRPEEKPVAALTDASPNLVWNAESGQALLTTGDLELRVETKKGLNACSLKNVKTGEVFADRDYAWPNGKLPQLKNAPKIVKTEDGSPAIVFTGILDKLEVEQTFTMPAKEPGVILESIAIRNPTDASMATADFKCGLTKCIRDGETFSKDATDTIFCPIPYRRETNGQMQEFPLSEVALHGMSYTGWGEPVVPTPIWGAEGWVWSKGGNTFLLAKYNRDSMEWSLMEPVKEGNETRVRFAGAGQWKHNHPEGATMLDAGKSYHFGETRLQAISGDWKHAYYAYRGYLDGKGCKPPKTYDPPVHWNELYDNEYYPRVCGLCDEILRKKGYVFCPEFHEGNKKLLAEFYSIDSMKLEAAKAKELGCQSLYMDPGWDTGPSHQVWDVERLGPMNSYVDTIRSDYGLKVSLWCSLAGVPPTYGDPEAVPFEARVLDKDGKPDRYLVCYSSPAFLDTKEKLLLDLAKNGAAFFMFDSDQYSGPCYDKSHGHPIPSTREEHAKALFELTRRVKVKYPNVLIEMHDPITGPCNVHYTPTYFGYQPPYSFDCLWGHEFMWNSMDDLLSRRAVSLYYFNLSYSIPIYLHVGLKTDNSNALMFWWYASVCRHLGVGGKPADPAVWEAQKKAMQTYLKLERFYKQGVFYGLDETVHVHTLPDVGQAVINCFNLGEQPVQKKIQFRLKEIGLPSAPMKIEDATFEQKDDEITLEVTIPARGQVMYKIEGK
jgi:hypothetical protein